MANVFEQLRPIAFTHEQCRVRVGDRLTYLHHPAAVLALHRKLILRGGRLHRLCQIERLSGKRLSSRPTVTAHGKLLAPPSSSSFVSTLAALAAASACSNPAISSSVGISPSSLAAIAFDGGDGGGERASSASSATTWSAAASVSGETRFLNNLVLPSHAHVHAHVHVHVRLVVEEAQADGTSSDGKLAGPSSTLYRVATTLCRDIALEGDAEGSGWGDEGDEMKRIIL
eukprot:scaffold19666_cov65-Phaeocystis_antarctica.AAC.1